MYRLLLGSLISLGTVACSEQPADVADFGAGHVVQMVVSAEKECAAHDYQSISDCAESTGNKAARLASLRAQDTYKIFQEACYESLGMSKCEALVEKSYSEAKKR
jgi:hypothetical protein